MLFVYGWKYCLNLYNCKRTLILLFIKILPERIATGAFEPSAILLQQHLIESQIQVPDRDKTITYQLDDEQYFYESGKIPIHD
jgi:hypothetical protein